MTNYQKRISEAAEKLYPNKSGVHDYEHRVFKNGYDQGHADALADVQPLVEAAKAYLKTRPYHDCTDNGEPQCEQCDLSEALAHFKTLGGKGE